MSRSSLTSPGQIATGPTTGAHAGLERWRAECAGEIAPQAELQDLRRRYGWTDEQVTLAFEALAGIAIHRINGSSLIFDRELTSHEASMLMKERLIRLDRFGWALTRKGEEMIELLYEYQKSV